MNLFTRVVLALRPASAAPVDRHGLSFWQRLVAALARRGSR